VMTGVAVGVLVSVTGRLPAASPVMVDIGRLHINDKIQHFCAYLALSLLPVIGFPDRRRGIVMGLSMFVLGIFLDMAAHILVCTPILLPIVVHYGMSPVQFGIIGTGSRGSYLLKHLKGIDNGRCVAACDINPEHLKHGVDTIGNNPKQYKDYRDLLAAKDVDAVIVTLPLFIHYPVTRDALLAGKHVFCEKCLVFKPEEVHALRALHLEHPKQTLQTGLQRRYSTFYQTVKQMVDKGILGDVHHMHAQWHRNMINKPSALWTMKPGGEKNIANWRIYRSMSGGIAAELTSHQVDIADWMFGSQPEFVMGLGSLDTLKDGRDVWDNVQLIYQYPKGRKMTYCSSSIK